MILGISMQKECVFDKFGVISDGVYVYTYTPQEKLRPDTVMADAFAVAAKGTVAAVEKAVYNPGENSVRLFLGDGLFAKKINVISEQLLSLDGTVVNCNETGYAMPYAYPGYEDISITGTAVYQNGIPVITLKEKINVQIRVSVTNATGVLYENKELVIKDKNQKIIAIENFDIGGNEMKDIIVQTYNYVFDSNDIDIIIR